MFKAMKYPKLSDDMFRVDCLEVMVGEAMIQANDPLLSCLANEELSL